ncbi:MULTISPECIES: STAS-like domain-containing protein [Thermoanaerobacter]|uniref:DUF4325 domain-containing protein n=1 Tax=Thermoanaerobacter pentosaceus TaxID=694059 RepID=A0ABT9M2L2_9THEO|nr:MULTISPECIES: STAS-like domain-containing protein [Thermoanaerobacter]MDP9750369.1 hypothetical protein [Thermoanaerobacter pentosaceus]
MLKLNAFGDILLGRELGKKVRDSIKDMLSKENKLIIDCYGVKGTSQSFADECFGRLVEEMGLENFKVKIKIQNAEPEIQSIIKYTVISRVHNQLIKAK